MLVPGLDRGIAILRMFRRDRPVLTAPQIATELAIPRSTVHRLLATLSELGLVRRDQDGRFALDAGILTLGHEYLAALDLPSLAAPLLEALCEETGWSAHLAVRQGRSIVYLSRQAGRAAVTRNVSVGTSLPAHATLMGRVLLADLEPTALHALYDGVSLAAGGPGTPTTFAALEQMIAADRRRGHAASDGFYEAGVRAIAVPVRDATLRVVAAINATAVGDDGADMPDVTEQVIAAAATLSRLLGAPPEAKSTARTAAGLVGDVRCR